MSEIKKYFYNFAMASITVDIAIFRINDKGAVQVLVIKRKESPFKGKFALPGGHCELETETIYEALVRETKEEVGFDISKAPCSFVGYYDNPKRDTRGRVISFCFTRMVYGPVTFVAGDDAESCEWINYEDVKNNVVRLAFDHNEMVRDAWEKLQNEV